MHFGITTVCIAPLLSQPQRGLMISQLLFGETFTINFEDNGWLNITCSDNLDAWVDKKQIQQLSQKEFEKITNGNTAYSFDAFNTGISKNEHLPIVLGSNLPQFDGLSFKLNKEKIIYNGQVIMPTTGEVNVALTEKICLKYLNAPYLAGGRSPFGIDAAGLAQMTLKLMNILIPRTIEEQKTVGKPLAFISQASDGDLVFCTNENGDNHVGIYLSGGRIAHAYGRVRIDKIDSHGIFDAQTNSYSHKIEMVTSFKA